MGAAAAVATAAIPSSPSPSAHSRDGRITFRNVPYHVLGGDDRITFRAAAGRAPIDTIVAGMCRR